MPTPKRPLPVAPPPSDLAIVLPLSSTWRRPSSPETPAAQPTNESADTPVANGDAQREREAAAPSAAAPTRPFVVPPGVVQGQTICPKCGAVQRPSRACARCGLLFANWRPGMEEQIFAGLKESVREELKKLWREAMQLEDDTRAEALKRFHETAARHKALAVAGDFCRRRLAAHPDDAEVLVLRNRLLLEAQRYLPAHPTARRGGEVSRRTLFLSLAAGVAMTALVTWLFLTLLRN